MPGGLVTFTSNRGLAYTCLGFVAFAAVTCTEVRPCGDVAGKAAEVVVRLPPR